MSEEAAAGPAKQGSDQQPGTQRDGGHPAGLEPGDSQPGDSQPGDSQPGGEPTGWDLSVPWAEPFGTGSPERARLATEFGAAVRKTGSLMNLVGQAAADRVGINATDLNCLNILSFSGQLTAGQLARATGLTTASITGVADRLEEAGFVRRERDARDRRRVVIRLVLDRVLSDIAPVFLPMIRALEQTAARYTDDELRLIVEFYGRIEQVFRDHLALLRDASES